MSLVVRIEGLFNFMLHLIGEKARIAKNVSIMCTRDLIFLSKNFVKKAQKVTQLYYIRCIHEI